MIKKEEIHKWVQEKMNELGGFVVDVKINDGNVIAVEIDKTDGIHVDECAAVNRYINKNLGTEEDYSLQVSSPGAESPFKVKEQYLKNIEKNVLVQQKDGASVQGKLLQYDDHQLIVEEKKNKEFIKHNILTENIKQTKRVLSFN